MGPDVFQRIPGDLRAPRELIQNLHRHVHLPDGSQGAGHFADFPLRLLPSFEARRQYRYRLPEPSRRHSRMVYTRIVARKRRRQVALQFTGAAHQ